MLDIGLDILLFRFYVIDFKKIFFTFQSPTSILNVLVSVHVRRKGGRFADRRLNLLCTLLPTLIAISVFSNSIFGDFVHDDLAAIVRNPDVNGDNNWTELFSNDFWGVPMSSVHSHKSYRPITVLLFR